MRIPNNTVHNKSYTNVNTNKGYLNKLNNQMSTEKKISKPSDDPMIAIRALRLRNNLSEIVQYHGANVPDAQAWVDVTRSSISSTTEMISSLKAYADQGANGTNSAYDRQKITENIQALQKQIYSNGNATNAGMSVFTGYRTDVALTFSEETNIDYRGIADTFNASDVTVNTYTDSPFSLESIYDVELEEIVGELDSTGKLTLPGTMYAAPEAGESFSITFQYGSEAPVEKNYEVTDEGNIRDTVTYKDAGIVDSNGIINLDPLVFTLTKNTEGHYENFTVTFQAGSAAPVTKTYSVSDDGVITAARTGETDVKEDRVNRIRLSYDNINTKIKQTSFGFGTSPVAVIADWRSAVTRWEDHVADGQLINDPIGHPNVGVYYTAAVTIDGRNVALTLDPKCDQTLDWDPAELSTNEICEMVGRFKEDSFYYGDVNQAGGIYATQLVDKTNLIYRTALEGDASIPVGSLQTDTTGEVKCFTVQYGNETYTIKKLDEKNNGGNNDGGWWAVANPDGSGAVLRHIEVTQNVDKSFTIKVNDDHSSEVGDDMTEERKVFNVSANARTVTSCYHETPLGVKITTSDAKVATDSEGNDLTAYQYLALDANDKNADEMAANAVYLLADTGELVFGSDVAAILGNLKDIPGVDTISVSYDKSNFEAGELRPEHYFDVKLMDDEHTPYDMIAYDDHEQAITYTVGTGQAVKINTNANEVFDPQIVRQMDDILTAIDGYNEVEAKVKRLEEMQADTASYSVDQQKRIQKLLDAANKELDVAKNRLQRTYEESITNFGRYFEQANQAETTCGTVENRLELVANRLSEEKTTVTTLASDNENVDITNVAVEVSEANIVYNAALMATGRIAQQSLVDYI